VEGRQRLLLRVILKSTAEMFWGDSGRAGAPGLKDGGRQERAVGKWSGCGVGFMNTA